MENYYSTGRLVLDHAVCALLFFSQGCGVVIGMTIACSTCCAYVNEDKRGFIDSECFAAYPMHAEDASEYQLAG